MLVFSLFVSFWAFCLSTSSTCKRFSYKKINNTLHFGPLNSTARPVVNFKIDDVHTFQWWTNECLSFHARLDSLPYTHQIARNLFWIPLAFHWARKKNTKSWQNLRSWSGPTDMNDDALTNFSSIWIILWLDSSFAYYTLSRCMYMAVCRKSSPPFNAFVVIFFFS